MVKYGEIGALLKGKKLKKPSLEVSVYKSHGEPMESMDDTKYLKEDLKRQKKDVLEYEELIEKWVPEDIAAMAKKKVEAQLADAKLRVSETRARIKMRSKKEVV